MNFQVLEDRVLIKKKEVVKTNSFGLVIPDDKSEKTIDGEIVAIGEGKPLDNGITRPMEVKVGELALYLKGSGTEVKIDGVEYIVLRESEIIGIIE
jgi:chaperonin GroES